MKIKEIILLSFFASIRAQDAPVRLPEVAVSKPAHEFQEEQPVGPYQQPQWTTQRRFSTTRVFVQRLPGDVEFEQWWRGRFFRDGTHSHLMQEEIEVGLPHRFQLDLYEDWTIDHKGRMGHQDFATELRWAPADWGVIPLNPTLYGEWKFTDKDRGPDVYELKLLLGEEIMARLHWGLNAIYEQEVSGGRATEWAWSQGLSYSLIDEKLSLGVEMKFSHETERGSRSQPEIKFLAGPSLQWIPRPGMHLDVVPLIGATHDAPRVEAFIIFGIDLWPGSREKRSYGPASLKGQ